MMKKNVEQIKGDPRGRIFFALSCDVRLDILVFLKDRERSTQEIVEHTGVHPSVVSRHLSVLQRAGLVVSRKQGTCVYWKISAPEVKKLLEISQKLVIDLREEEKRAFRKYRKRFI